MAASEAAVTAVMETLGCRRSKTHRMIGGGRESWCVMHNWSTWTDRCPVAVAAADAVWPIAQAEALREAADVADRSTITGLETTYPDRVARWLRARADRIEAQP